MFCLESWIAEHCPALPGESLTEAVARHQLHSLNATLCHARRSAFYREQFGTLAELPRLDALARLPFTFPADLTEWGRFLCVSQGEVARIVTLHTSGTTGIPKRLAFTQNDLARTRCFFRAGMGQLVRHGDHVAVLLPGADRPDGVTDLLRQALPEACVTSETVDDVLAVQKASVLVLLPEQLERILSAPWPALHGVLTSGEVLLKTLRQKSLEALPGRLVLDHYGLTESGFGCGVECSARAGYHLREPDLLVEIVDSAGNTLPMETWGEVVITTLHREAMPLIRYRTGDISRLLLRPCPCGNPFPRLDHILGRIDALRCIC